MKKLLSIKLILIFSVLINCIAFYYIYNSFTKLQYSRIFPLGFNPSAQAVSRKEIKRNDTLLMIGDSRVAMWPKQYISKEIYNIAHGGQTSSQVLLQLQGEKLSNKGVAFLQVCINDIHSIKAIPDLKKQVMAQCKNNIVRITELLTVQGYKVILSTLYPPDTPPLSRKLFWPEDFKNIFDEINTFIKSQENNNVFVLDAFSLLKQTENYYLKEEYIDDDFFLHINESAYKKLSIELYKMLLKL